MKITFIKPFKRKKNNVMMKHLRYENTDSKQGSFEKMIELKNKVESNIRDKKEKITMPKVKNIKKKQSKEGKEFALKNVLKKNQIALFSISLMLITAGYLNYSNNLKMAALGDAKLVSTNITDLNENEDKDEDVDVDVEETKANISMQENSNISDNNQVIDTNSSEFEDKKEDEKNDYFIQSKLDRNTMFSQMIETYEKILANEQIPNDQKSIAVNEIKNINDRKSAISTIENLLKTKGLEETLILINDNSIDVVVKSKENLQQETVAQILNIVSRELNAQAEDIHISTYN